jgi:hypothetical protein
MVVGDVMIAPPTSAPVLPFDDGDAAVAPVHEPTGMRGTVVASDVPFAENMK